jgi:hypothetical protein
MSRRQKKKSNEVQFRFNSKSGITQVKLNGSNVPLDFLRSNEPLPTPSEIEAAEREILLSLRPDFTMEEYLEAFIRYHARQIDVPVEGVTIKIRPRQ